MGRAVVKRSGSVRSAGVARRPSNVRSATPQAAAPGWTFFSNHSHVLVCLAADPVVRLRDVADRVGITERAVQGIVADLEEAGVITRRRDGRRNRYEIHADVPLRHPVEAHKTVRAILEAILGAR